MEMVAISNFMASMISGHLNNDRIKIQMVDLLRKVSLFNAYVKSYFSASHIKLYP